MQAKSGVALILKVDPELIFFRGGEQTTTPPKQPPQISPFFVSRDCI